MKNQLISYLKKNNITNSNQVDRLLSSAFIVLNNIKIENNLFILDYFIKDIDHDKNLLDELLFIISKNFKSFGFEELISSFEYVISPSDRIVNGAVYTPPKIRSYITESSLENLNYSEDISVADISCGCGGFLFTASKYLKKISNKSYYEIFKNNIYGNDIQISSVIRTKILLTLLALYNNEDASEFIFNIYHEDSLSFDWNKVIPLFNGFDFIIGNPPYVCSRNLSDETKELLKKWSVCSSGNPDLYIPFFQIGLNNLSKNGILSYITMNTFFKSLNGRSLREYFHINNIHIKIIDFGSKQIFHSKNTYTCICTLRKRDIGFIEYFYSKNVDLLEIPFDRVSYEELDHKKGWNLREIDMMERIESIGVAFSKKYKTRHGIATLKNSVYIFKPITEDDTYYYLENNNKIEKEICRDIINSNKLSGNYTLNDLVEKIIFPYIEVDRKTKIIPENIIKNLYPFAYSYLLKNKEILKSRDKGKNSSYPTWYAYGRTQSLLKLKHKLFIPKISNSSPNSIISSDDNLMFYNGIAIIGESLNHLLIIQKLINSRLFWYYITRTSKPYSSDYYSLNGNYINNFGIPLFSDKEINYILSEENEEKLDFFIENKYNIQIPDNFKKK